MNILPRFVRATEWRGPQAILITTSSPPSKNAGFSSSSPLLAKGESPGKLVMFANYGRSSFDLLNYFLLEALKVSTKKLAFGFFCPPGSKVRTKSGFFLS